MFELPVLALTTGAWAALVVLVGFTVVALLAVSTTKAESETSSGETAGYIFGLGKIPRLRRLPERRDVPATPKPLEPEGLRTLGKKLDASTRFDTDRYRMASGVRRPWELSDDVPDSIEALEVQRSSGGVVLFTREGHIMAQPPLSDDEIEELEDIVRDVMDRPGLRADRRTWAESAESPEAINAKRV